MDEYWHSVKLALLRHSERDSAKRRQVTRPRPESNNKISGHCRRGCFGVSGRALHYLMVDGPSDRWNPFCDSS